MLEISSHQNSSIFFVRILDAVQIRRIFFLLATLHTQKKVKEIAYILTSYQALLKAQLFFLLFVLRKENKENRQNNGNEVFICFSFPLIQFFIN